MELPLELQQNVECGGLQESVSGMITYRRGQPLDNFELCVWTVHTPLKSEIQIRLLEDGFVTNHDYVSIYTVDWKEVDKSKLAHSIDIKKGDREPKIVAGPLIYIVFKTNNQSPREGTGFVLNFEGLGTDLDATNTPSYSLHNSAMTLGTFDYNKSPDTEGSPVEIFSFVIQNPQSLKIWDFNNNINHASSLFPWNYDLNLYEFYYRAPFPRLRIPYKSIQSVELEMKREHPALILLAVKKEYSAQVSFEWQ